MFGGFNMALKDYPDWVLLHKGKGKEIRFLQGKYYLYLVHTKRIDGKVKKFTDKYLGRITEDGLIPPTEKIIDYTVKLYGFTAFIFSSCKNIIDSIIERFPSRHQKLLTIAFLSYFFNKDYDEYENHYISILFPKNEIKQEKDSIQNEINRIISMFDHTITKKINGIPLNDLKKLLSTIYIVGVKDKWTIASYNELAKKTINKYNIELRINYGQDK